MWIAMIPLQGEDMTNLTNNTAAKFETTYTVEVLRAPLSKSTSTKILDIVFETFDQAILFAQNKNRVAMKMGIKKRVAFPVKVDPKVNVSW